MLGNLQHTCPPEKVGMNPAKGSLSIPMGFKKQGFYGVVKQSAMKLISVNNGWMGSLQPLIFLNSYRAPQMVPSKREASDKQANQLNE